MQSSDPHGQPWLTLQEASERLSVHPATLRQWADRGRVRTFRTPGGHRRFAAQDVEALLGAGPGRPAELDLLQDAGLGRVRRELAGGRLAAQPWHRLLDPAARDRFRRLGRELLALLVCHLGATGDPAASLADARALAREQGRLAREGQLALPDVVRTYTLFRDMVLESALQVRAVQDPGASARDLARVHRRVGSLLDEALVACVEAYSEAAG